MTVIQAIHQAEQVLKEARVPDARLSAKVLMCHTLRWTQEQLMIHAHTHFAPDCKVVFDQLIEKRAKRIPVAYLVGQKEFYGRVFSISPSVLIPRPETEQLIDWTLNTFSKMRTPHICDVGTGSGVIAITLAKELPEAQVVGVDVSAEALEVAQTNARQHQAQVQWRRAHLLACVEDCFDLVIANLPYVAPKDRPGLQPEVLQEPEEALFAERDGYALLEELIAQAFCKTKPGGWLVLEHGCGQGASLLKSLQKTGWIDVKGYNDLAGIDRMVVGQRPLQT